MDQRLGHHRGSNGTVAGSFPSGAGSGEGHVETALRNRIITQYNMTMYTYLILYNILYI